MSKSIKKAEASTESDAFEMIELAIDDLEVLTRAFNLISDICAEDQDSDPRLDDRLDELLLN